VTQPLLLGGLAEACGLLRLAGQRGLLPVQAFQVAQGHLVGLAVDGDLHLGVVGAGLVFAGRAVFLGGVLVALGGLVGALLFAVLGGSLGPLSRGGLVVVVLGWPLWGVLRPARQQG
jgi:hypothetical protein